MNKKRPGLAHLKKFYSTSALYIPSLWLNLCRYWKGKKKYFWKDKNKIKRWNKERKLKNFHFVFDRDDDDPVGRRSKMRFKKLNYWFQSLPPSLSPPPPVFFFFGGTRKSSFQTSLTKEHNCQFHFVHSLRRQRHITYLPTYLSIYLPTYLPNNLPL